MWQDVFAVKCWNIAAILWKKFRSPAQESGRNSLVERLGYGEVLSEQELAQISKDSPKILEAAMVGLVRTVNGEKYEDARHIQTQFNVSEKNLSEKPLHYAVSTALKYLNWEDVESALRLTTTFNIPAHALGDAAPHMRPILEKAVETALNTTDSRGDTLLSAYGKRHNFEKILYIVQMASDTQREQLCSAIPVQQFHSWLQQEVEEKNYLSAKLVLDIASTLGVEVAAQDGEQISRNAEEESARRQQRPTLRESYGQIRLESEIAIFYLLQSLGHVLRTKEDQIMNARPLGKEISLSDRVILADANTFFKQEVRRSQSWMQQYLLSAVQGEISEQTKHTKIGHRQRVRAPLLTQNEMSEKITAEEAREYCVDSAYIFNDPSWQSFGVGKLFGLENSWGGRLWSDTAETTHNLWKDGTNPFEVALNIDHAYSLQHHNGDIFSKDPARIKYNEDFDLKKVLDIVFESDAFDVLNSSLHEYLGDAFPAEYAQKIKDKIARIESLTLVNRTD